MKEFKEGTLKTSAGKKVKSRKQAVAIAMSESEGYAEKADLISQINIDSVQEAEDILKAAGTEELFEKAKHQDGDMHPNGKWVWVSSANGGKGDWRTKGGRTHTKHSAGGNAGSTTNTTSTSTQKKPSSQYSPMTIKTTKSDGSVSEVKDYGEVKKFKQNGKDVYSIQFKNNSTHGVFSSAKDAQSVIDDAKSKESKPSPQIVGTTKKITSDKQFLDTFRDASDDILNNIVSGKIQASDKEKKLAQQILDERKKPKVGDVSKLTAQQKSMVDKVMDKGFLMTNNKYNDKSKIELKKTDKGNWRCYYDGKDIGVTIAGSTITDSAAKKIGWYKEGVESKTTSSDSTEKPKKRPIAVGTNGPEKRNTKISLPDKMESLSYDMDEKYLSDERPYVYTNNGFADLNKQGAKGYGIWVGFEHKSRGKQPVNRNQLSNFVRNTAVEHLLKEVNKKTGRKYSKEDVVIEDRWNNTDMFRIYIKTDE